MYANKPEMAERWEEHTPKGRKLPESKKESEMTNKKQAAITPEMIGAGIGATGAGLAAHLLSKKNKARNILLAVLGGGLAGSAGGAGYRAYGQSKGLEKAVSNTADPRPQDEIAFSRIRKSIPSQAWRNALTLGLSQPEPLTPGKVNERQLKQRYHDVTEQPELLAPDDLRHSEIAELLRRGPR